MPPRDVALDAQWARSIKNPDVTTGPLPRSFARSLDNFSHSLAQGAVNDRMAI